MCYRAAQTRAIGRRGRGRTDEAVARYAKSHVCVQALAQVPPHVLERGRRLLEQRDVIEPSCQSAFAEPCPELTVVKQFFTVAERMAQRRALVHEGPRVRAL